MFFFRSNCFFLWYTKKQSAGMVSIPHRKPSASITKRRNSPWVRSLISLATGKVDFTNLFIALDGQSYPTLDAAKASTSVFAYGSFIQTVIQFLIIAFSIFMVVKGINMLRRPKPEAAPTTKECPYCKSEIHIDAVKCPHCASELSKKWVLTAPSAA